jgi:hypothetical protein
MAVQVSGVGFQEKMKKIQSDKFHRLRNADT